MKFSLTIQKFSFPVAAVSKHCLVLSDRLLCRAQVQFEWGRKDDDNRRNLLFGV